MRTDIVVGVDASPGSASALAWALDEASRRGVRVRAVLAWADDSRPAEVDAIATSPRLEDLAAAADKVLRRLVATARAAGAGGSHQTPNRARVAIDERAVYGTAVHALLQESLDAGMLVIGAESPAASRWALPNLVGDACAHEAPVPLVVVPADAGTALSRDRAGKPVLVGVDGSPASAVAARWAAGEAALRGVPLRVLHVADVQGTTPARPRAQRSRAQVTIPLVTRAPALPRTSAGTPIAVGGRSDGCGWAPVAAARTNATVGHIDRVVAEVRAMPGAPSVGTVSLVGRDTAAHLLEATLDAQLLVVGARGTGGFPALSLGGTARRCLAHVSCPTAVVRGHGY